MPPGFEPRLAFQNDDYSAILGFVAAGVGLALIPDMVSRGARDDVVIRLIDPPPPPRPIGAVLPGRLPLAGGRGDARRAARGERGLGPGPAAAAPPAPAPGQRVTELVSE